MKKLLLILSLSALAMACASMRKSSTEMTTSDSGETLFKLDTNKDGKTDCLWSKNTKDPNNPLTLWRKDDLNYDGKYDIEQYYAQGKLLHEKLDLDFDGTFDAFNYYEKGIISKSEYALSHNTKIDMWIFYKDGKPVKKEVDTKKSGKADYFEFYKDSKIDRIGRDYDDDGIIDVWE